MKQNRIQKKRVVIPISGDVLKALMDLRAILEREGGVPVSLTAIVKAIIMVQRKEAEENGRAQVEDTILAIERFEREGRKVEEAL